MRVSVLQRLYRTLAAPDTPASHIVVEPVVETGEVHTRFSLLSDRIRSYFVLAGLEPPATADLTLTVYDGDGRARHREVIAGHAIGAPFVWDSRARLRGLAAPVEGTAAVETVLYDRGGARVPEALIEAAYGHKSAGLAELYCDYYAPGRFITTTHSNIVAKTPPPAARRAIARWVRAATRGTWTRRWRSPAHIRAGAVAVFDDGERESALLCYTWREGTRPREIGVELRNADGASRHASIPALAPRALREFPLERLFPGARAFLGGRMGNLLLERPFPLLETNPRFYVRTRHVARPGFTVEHAAMEHTASPTTSRAAWRAMGKGYHSPAVVLERAGVRTLLALFNVVDVAAPKRYGVRLYDAAGKLVVDQPCAAEVPPRGHALVAIRELLDAAGWPGDFTGHAEVAYTMDTEAYPDTLHHQVLYAQDGLIEGVQHSAGSWNAPRDRPEPPGVRDPQALGRLPIWAAVGVDEELSSALALTNCSHAHDYDVDAHVTVSLHAGANVVAAGDVVIPPHGLWFEPVERLFPDCATLLRPHGGRGLALIRPRNVRTLGAQVFHVVRATGRFSSEHTL
ncbi:MAG: hypothetical protein FJ027_22000 [Candidatus Rokubacteria bacterium]|nr:hypothetical protein [Candidatus Rokubacteria bacterium]